MAWLERKGTKFRIRFRFGGKKQFVALNTKKERDANTCLARFEENLRLAERGRLDIPDDADVGLFLLSDGKVNRRPQDEKRDKPITLAQLFTDYRENFPKGAKEANTRYTERLHMAHLERLIGGTIKIHTITAKTLQIYVTARSQEKSRLGRTISSRTIKKEIGTLTAIWNQWAIPQGLAAVPLPTRLLTFDKERTKPPFHTREQIDRQIARGGLSPEEEQALWGCLFLTLPEIGEVLEDLHRKNCPAFVYPLFVFAAHTGARRSEMLRSRITDFDFEANVVTIREKKRDRDMQAWFAIHPGGPLTVCTSTAQPITLQITLRRRFVLSRILRHIQ